MNMHSPSVRPVFAYLIGMLFLWLATCATSAKADALDDILARKKLIVGAGLVVPPYNYLDDKLRPSGSDVEVARLLAKDMGVEVEFARIQNSTAVDFLLAKKADVVISTFSVTLARQQQVDFSIPYGSILSVLAGPKAAKVSGFKDLTGKSVAVLRDSTNDKHVTEGGSNLSVVRVDANNTLITLMVSGQQEYVATAPSMVDEMNKKKGEPFLETKFVLRSTPYAIGFRKNGGKLQEYVDAWVKRNLANGKINEIFKQHHGVNISDDVIKMTTVVN